MNHALVTRRTTCRLCGSGDVRLGLKLAGMPIVSPNTGGGRNDRNKGGVLDHIDAPLEVFVCNACGFAQVLDIVDPDLIYRDYLYKTSVSQGLADHFRGLASSVIERLSLAKGSLVVEFGANEGTLLTMFRDAGMNVLGVDPATAIVEEAAKRGLPMIADYFSASLAEKVLADKGPAKVIVSNNCVANIDDLDGIFKGVARLLGNDGVFVCETQYGPDVVSKFLLDTIYHEHLSYFGLAPLVKALSRHGLKVMNADMIDTKGGSIRLWIEKIDGHWPVSPRVAELTKQELKEDLYGTAALAAFTKKLDGMRAEIRKMVDEVRARKGKVAIFGSSVGCVALMHQFELQDEIDFILDDAPVKDHLAGPGYSIPVIKGSETPVLKPDLVLILAWRYAEPIMRNYKAALPPKGRFVVPLPDVQVFPGSAK